MAIETIRTTTTRQQVFIDARIKNPYFDATDDPDLAEFRQLVAWYEYDDTNGNESETIRLVRHDVADDCKSYMYISADEIPYYIEALQELQRLHNENFPGVDTGA